MEYETPTMDVTFFGGNIRTSVVDASNIDKGDGKVDFTGPDF